MVSTRMHRLLLIKQDCLSELCRFFGKAVLGLIQAFCFNWLYFEIGQFEHSGEAKIKLLICA